MKVVILDPAEQREAIRRRRATGADRYDEVWDGVYVMSPLADIEHQDLAMLLSMALLEAIGGRRHGMVLPGTNVSDRETDWKKNFRCPDVAVFLPGNPAQNRESHWFGGPDFAVEVISPRDRSRKKGAFYAKLGTRELLFVDRRPWQLELYRLQDRQMRLVGKSTLEQSDLREHAMLSSTVLPVTFQLRPGNARPGIEIIHTKTGQQWLI